MRDCLFTRRELKFFLLQIRYVYQQLDEYLIYESNTMEKKTENKGSEKLRN